MAITSEFRNTVENGKKIRVRIILKDSMLVDPTLKQFDEMLEFAKENMQDLFDEQDEEILKYDCSEWNETYLNNQMVKVVNNFSQERINLLRDMIKYIYRDKADKIKSDRSVQNNMGVTRKQVGVGITTVGAVAAVAGVCAHQSILIAGGVVAAAVGVGLIVTDKER